MNNLYLNTHLDIVNLSYDSKTITDIEISHQLPD